LEVYDPFITGFKNKIRIFKHLIRVSPAATNSFLFSDINGAETKGLFLVNSLRKYLKNANGWA
jgi:hypothetical protein